MVRKIYGRQPVDPMKDLNVNLAIWRMFKNTTFRAAVDLGKDDDMNLRISKELSLENNGTAFQRNRKADQWSDRNHWHKPDHFPRLKVSIDKVMHSRAYQYSIAKVCLLRLCALFGENGRQILLNPGSSKFNGIRTTNISAN